MTFTQAMLLAILQGVSELFPISSLGHTILIPALLHWQFDRSDPTYLAFVVVLHLGTALALVFFYRKEWAVLVHALIASIVRGKISGDPKERIAWLLVVGTIPVGILGLLLKDPVRQLFGTVTPVAIFLMVNALIMFAGEYLRQRQLRGGKERIVHPSIDRLTFPQSVLVGFGQALALFPGISRSGSSMVASLLCGLDHEEAAHYSFLLATPVILAASLLEIPELWQPGTQVVAVQAMLGCILAGIAAYVSVAFLTRYFKNNDLRPFGWYCLLFGALTLILARAGYVH